METKQSVLEFLNTHTDWAEPAADNIYRYKFHGQVYIEEFHNDAQVNRRLNDLSNKPIYYTGGPDELY